VVAGSGMTAAVQVARLALAQGGDEAPELFIVSSDRSDHDLFYVREMERLQREFPGKLHIHRTLTRDAPAGWGCRGGEGTGRLCAEVLERHLPEPGDDVAVLVCGPDAFVHHVAGGSASANLAPPIGPEGAGGALAAVGFAPESVIVL